MANSNDFRPGGGAYIIGDDGVPVEAEAATASAPVATAVVEQQDQTTEPVAEGKRRAKQ